MTVSIAHATPAVAVSAALFAWMWQRSAAGLNPAGLQMPAMHLQHQVAYWWPYLMGETLGISALIWSYLSVLIGLAFSTRTRWLGVPRARLNDLHRHLSMTSLLIIAGHVVFVAVGSMDGAMRRTVNVTVALLPFQSSWNQQFYDTGVFAFYLAVLLGPTYYLRKRIGVRWWRIAHRASLAVYVLSVWHTFGFGDFYFNGPYRLALWIAQIPVAALLLWRLATPVGSAPSLRRSRAIRALAGVPVAAALVAIVAIVVSGNIGGSPSPLQRPAPAHHHTHHSAPTSPQGVGDSPGSQNPEDSIADSESTHP